MAGRIRPMRLKNPLRKVQSNRANLPDGRLLWWSVNTSTLARRCRRGASTPPRWLVALVELWSTSPVQGQTDRLKLLKQIIYRRIKVDLLRCPVLAAARGGHAGRAQQLRSAALKRQNNPEYPAGICRNTQTLISAQTH